MVRAIELPMLRFDTLRDLNSQEASLPRDVLDEARAEGMDTSFPEVMRKQLVQGVSAGELFFVSAEMTALAQAAAQTLPDFTLEEFDLISPAGYMIFESPIIRMDEEGNRREDSPDVVGMMWSLNPGDGVAAVGYLVRSGLLRCQTVGYIILGHHDAVSGQEWMDQAHAQVQGILKATWLLMRQPLAIEETPSFDRPARRRMQRAQVEPRPVRVIKLRRPKSDAHNGSDREYHHQWIVRGHWRQQWYPTKQVHRPVWIAPHVKGPEGAPFLGGEKVHAWTR